MPAVAEEGAARRRPRDPRRGQRLDRRQRRGGRADSRRARRSGWGGTPGSAAANNAGIRESRGELLLLLNSDTLVPPGAIDRLVERLAATDGRRGRGPAPGGRRGSAGAVVRPHDLAAERVPAEAADRGVDRGRNARASSSSTGSAAPACWSAARTPKRRGCSTSGSSSTPRTSTSATPSGSSAARYRSRRRPTITHLRGRSRATSPRRAARPTGEPGRVLPEAPSSVRAAAAAVPPLEG